MLTTWSSGPSPFLVPGVVGLHKELCFDWSNDLRTSVLFAIRENVTLSSFWYISKKQTSNPTSFYSTPFFSSFPLQLFLRLHSTAFLPFLNMYVSSLKAKSFPRLKALRLSLLPCGAPRRSSSFFCSKLFFSSFSFMLLLNGYILLELPTLPSYKVLTEQLVTPYWLLLVLH